ncbi:hypothetical protein CLM82_05790, partial [Streptomyces albidoflavus]
CMVALTLRHHSLRLSRRPVLLQTSTTNIALFSHSGHRALLLTLWVPNGLIVGCEALFISSATPSPRPEQTRARPAFEAILYARRPTGPEPRLSPAAREARNQPGRRLRPSCTGGGPPNPSHPPRPSGHPRQSSPGHSRGQGQTGHPQNPGSKDPHASGTMGA